MYKSKNVSPIFFISTLFMLIPIINSFEIENGIYLFIATILFLIAYLLILYTTSRILDRVFWLYLNAYIIVTTLYVNIYMTWFIAYLINLMTWHYQERNYFSKRFLIMWVTSVVCMGAVLFSDLHIINKVALLSTIAISFSVQLVINMHARQEKLQEAIYENNKSINLLLADNERNRISRDLHDTLGHVFTTLTLKTDLALMLLKQGNYDLIEKELQEIRHLSSQEMKNVRRLIEGFQNRTISEELIVIQNMLSIANINLTLSSDDTTTILTSIQNNISMILRELTNNLLKHANATQCSLKLMIIDSHLIINYEDNGVGFDFLTGEELTVIKNRLVILKGELHIRSLKHPTKIEMIVPLEEV